MRAHNILESDEQKQVQNELTVLWHCKSLHQAVYASLRNLDFVYELAFEHARANKDILIPLLFDYWTSCEEVWQLGLVTVGSRVRIFVQKKGESQPVARDVGAILPLELHTEKEEKKSYACVWSQHDYLKHFVCAAKHSLADLCTPCSCLASDLDVLLSSSAQACVCGYGLAAAAQRHARTSKMCPLSYYPAETISGGVLHPSWGMWAARWFYAKNKHKNNTSSLRK